MSDKHKDIDQTTKKVLFDYLKDIPDKDIKHAIEGNNTPILIRQIVSDIISKITDSTENRAVLATGILHFFLTNAMIPSQRKIEHNGKTIDIVIPNLKTLIKKPESALVIIISNSNKDLTHRIKETMLIQPVRNNIWCVLVNDAQTNNKKFVVGGESFNHIMNEIARFVTQNNVNSKLKVV